MFEGVDRLIDEKNSDQHMLVDGGDKEGGSRQQKYMDGYSMQGRGWWPAIVVSWDGEHLAFSNFDHRTYYDMQNQGRIRIWVICWYQLWDGTLVVEAWPIHLLTPMCRV